MKRLCVLLMLLLSGLAFGQAFAFSPVHCPEVGSSIEVERNPSISLEGSMHTQMEVDSQWTSSFFRFKHKNVSEAISICALANHPVVFLGLTRVNYLPDFISLRTIVIFPFHCFW